MALVLVVDDETSIANLLAELLQDFGHATLQASNGLEALALARLYQPALIITDVMMPMMDGLCLLQAVRDTPELIHTAVILASAAPSCMHDKEYTTQADGYMQKPFDISVIEYMLNRFVPAVRFASC